LEHRLLQRVVFSVMFVAVTAHLPVLWARAAAADAALRHAIPATLGDDSSYQILAINLLHGRGYSTAPALPPHAYRLDVPPVQASPAEAASRDGQFRRSPGLSLMLAGVYWLAGTDTIAAQGMMAVLTWLSAVLLLLTGAVAAGWLGSMAGGLTALYHLHLFPGTYGFERILSEGPTAFWVVLLGFFLTLFLKRPRPWFAIGSGLSMAAVALMRANFLPVLPLLVGYLLIVRQDRRLVLMFAAAAAAPIIAWSAHASTSMGRPVLISMAGERLFANSNNADTLEGVGPERWNRGGWNPGFSRRPDGTYENDFHNQARPGESGWHKGLAFWRASGARLPELFFVKLRAGFWFADGASINWLRPGRFFLLGIGYLIIALGFLPRRLPGRRLMRASPDQLLAAQVIVLSALFLLGNWNGLLPVIGVWITLAAISLLRLQGPPQVLPIENPAWLTAFVVSHGLTTIVFYGTMRFHLPVDSSLMLVCFLGVLLTVYESARRSAPLLVGYSAVLVVTVVLPFLRDIVLTP
jgi:hypothetical protein